MIRIHNRLFLQRIIELGWLVFAASTPFAQSISSAASTAFSRQGSLRQQSDSPQRTNVEAKIIRFLSRQEIRAGTQDLEGWSSTRDFAIVDAQDNIIAFAEFQEMIPCDRRSRLNLSANGKCFSKKFKAEIVFRLTRYLGADIVFPGDRVREVDLEVQPDNYEGSVGLLVKDEVDISSRYKPLVTQGNTIGPTAALLGDSEQIMSFLGSYSYGINNRWMVSTLIPANISGAPNISTKVGFWQGERHSLSGGVSLARNQDSNEYTVATSFYWDSVTGENQISHNSVNIAVGTWDINAESENLTLLGSSTIQTGYEFILANWNRVLVGPRYNFERNAVGGYLGYKWIWDHYHLLVTLNSADIAHFEYSLPEGYFLLLDMYWRF